MTSKCCGQGSGKGHILEAYHEGPVAGKTSLTGEAGQTARLPTFRQWKIPQEGTSVKPCHRAASCSWHGHDGKAGIGNNEAYGRLCSYSETPPSTSKSYMEKKWQSSTF